MPGVTDGTRLSVVEIMAASTLVGPERLSRVDRSMPSSNTDESVVRADAVAVHGSAMEIIARGEGTYGDQRFISRGAVLVGLPGKRSPRFRGKPKPALAGSGLLLHEDPDRHAIDLVRSGRHGAPRITTIRNMPVEGPGGSRLEDDLLSQVTQRSARTRQPVSLPGTAGLDAFRGPPLAG